MKLIINGERSIHDVQKDFNEAYPYLKIEFFRQGNKKAVQPSAKNILNHSLTIDEARRLHNNGRLEIKDAMKVGELEYEFKEQYGLNVQVFRKSGNIWLETTMTDAWTLKQQNDHGREISTSF